MAEKKRSEKDRERWSQDVTEGSDALDLEEGMFTWDDPARIARSLKRSAESSDPDLSEPAGRVRRTGHPGGLYV